MTSSELGARMREARSAKGWSQEALAHAAQVSASIISRYERGVRHGPLVATIDKIADALDVSPTWLLTGTGSGPDEAAA